MNLRGTTVAGRYEIVDLLGQGGEGSVYKAGNEPLGGKLVTAKVIDISVGLHRKLRDIGGRNLT